MRWRVDEDSIMTARKTRANSRKWACREWLMRSDLPAHILCFSPWTKECLDTRTDIWPQTNKGSADYQTVMEDCHPSNGISWCPGY